MKLATLVAALLLAASAGVASADLVVRSDHSILDGKVVSQDSKELVFQPDGADSKTALHLPRAGVVQVILTDAHGAALPDPAAPAQPVHDWHVPPDPVAPPIAAPLKTPTYYVIPLHGAVGETYLASALEKSLADAVLRKPTVVVLDINSPGGMVSEAEAILKILHHYNQQLRIVALTDQDLSASAIVTLSVREIYVKPTSTIGAATSFIPNDPNLSAKVEEKMQSAWRAVARNSAEEGGHEPLLAESMIDNDRELHLETVNGKPVVKEGPGDTMLCRKGKILTLTSHEAVECGLAAGEAEDIADLGAKLKLDHWTECRGLGTLLADALPKRQQLLESEMKKIVTDFLENLDAAKASDPTAGEITTRIVNSVPGRPMPPRLVHVRGGRVIVIPRTAPEPGGHLQQVQTQIITSDVRAKWKDRSLACVLAFQKMEQDLKDAMALARAFGQGDQAASIAQSLDSISIARARIYDERDKYLHDAVAQASSPSHTDIPVVAPPPADPAADAAQLKKIAGMWQPGATNPVEILPTLYGVPMSADGTLTFAHRPVMSKAKYQPPVTIRMILKTDGQDTRINYAAQQIIFNWEMNPDELRVDGGPANGRHKKGAGALPANQWVALELVVKTDEMEIFVNGEKRYETKADFSKIDQQLGIWAHRSIVQIKSITIAKP